MLTAIKHPNYGINLFRNFELQHVALDLGVLDIVHRCPDIEYATLDDTKLEEILVVVLDEASKQEPVSSLSHLIKTFVDNGLEEFKGVT